MLVWLERKWIAILYLMAHMRWYRPIKLIRAHIISTILLMAFYVPTVISAEKEKTIHFHVPNFPPYIYLEDNQIKGELLDDIERIFTLAELPYTITVGSTFSRSVHLLEKQLSDGFFPATQNLQRDELAQFSSPIVSNNWSWFIPKRETLEPSHPRFKHYALVGTHFQTNTHRWLINNEYHVVGLPQTIEKLLKMLDNGRINSVFLSESAFYYALAKQGRSPDEFNIYLESTRPIGLYLSNHYLMKHPDAMDKINTAIKQLEY